MALGLLPLLLAGGGIKLGVDRHFAQQDRDMLQQGVQDAFGIGQGQGQGGLFQQAQGQPQIQADGSIGPAPGTGQQQGGLFPSAGDPQSMIQSASQLFGLPGGDALGRSLIEQAFGFEQSNIEQRAGFEQQLLEQGNRFDQRDLEQDNQQAFTSTQNAIDLDHDATQRQLDRDARSSIAFDKSQALSATNQFGAIPAGHQRIGLEGGGSAIVPMQGSVRYDEAEKNIDTMEGTVETMGRVINTLETSGTELVGQKAGELATDYAEALLRMKDVFGLGVLNEGDERILNSLIQDPTTYDALLTGNKKIIGQFQAAMRIVQRELRNENDRTALWGIRPSVLGTSTPKQIQQAQADTAQLEAEALGGLVPVPGPGEGGGPIDHRSLF